MPEGKGYGPQDTASIGKNLNVIGNHLYGCSGPVAVTDSAIALIEDTTGNYVTCQGSAGHMSISITGVETDN